MSSFSKTHIRRSSRSAAYNATQTVSLVVSSEREFEVRTGMLDTWNYTIIDLGGLFVGGQMHVNLSTCFDSFVIDAAEVYIIDSGNRQEYWKETDKPVSRLFSVIDRSGGVGLTTGLSQLMSYSSIKLTDLSSDLSVSPVHKRYFNMANSSFRSTKQKASLPKLIVGVVNTYPNFNRTFRVRIVAKCRYRGVRVDRRPVADIVAPRVTF